MTLPHSLTYLFLSLAQPYVTHRFQNHFKLVVMLQEGLAERFKWWSACLSKREAMSSNPSTEKKKMLHKAFQEFQAGVWLSSRVSV
jgi:hypothetical protein